jgi:hypothetical protein
MGVCIKLRGSHDLNQSWPVIKEGKEEKNLIRLCSWGTTKKKFISSEELLGTI